MACKIKGKSSQPKARKKELGRASSVFDFGSSFETGGRVLILYGTNLGSTKSLAMQMFTELQSLELDVRCEAFDDYEFVKSAVD